MLFDEVRFMPGPLADELLSVFQRERRPLAVLRDPIAVRIAGRKVYQEGLVIPVGNLASIGVNGSVDFDQNLDLVARFALPLPGLSVPVLTPIMENVKFDLPIRGTLKNPKIDGEALKEHWKAVGVDLLGDGMQAGVDGLQRLLQGLPVPGLRVWFAPVDGRRRQRPQGRAPSTLPTGNLPMTWMCPGSSGMLSSRRINPPSHQPGPWRKSARKHGRNGGWNASRKRPIGADRDSN